MKHSDKQRIRTRPRAIETSQATGHRKLAMPLVDLPSVAAICFAETQRNRSMSPRALGSCLCSGWHGLISTGNNADLLDHLQTRKDAAKTKCDAPRSDVCPATPVLAATTKQEADALVDCKTANESKIRCALRATVELPALALSVLHKVRGGDPILIC